MILVIYLMGSMILVAEPRSTRSPGCSEAEPWVRFAIEKLLALKGRCLLAGDLLRPFRTMGI